ncbi:Phospholipase D eukaryota [Penicillium coprophilum]|uniref:Phospholipase D eukaryota n=1 Tax=Penicillium coprophilum TaxID=36646 RepID=UPI0023A6608E|nr:Phospholipase D eukaryota [Penicillium coprophilum]KAJ5154117.1 Phospholipase D eukaryota [Penicillium coprophilum]
MSASSVHKDVETGSLKVDTKKQELLLASNISKLASPLPSPTEPKKPASIKQTQPTQPIQPTDDHETGGILGDKENARPSSLQHGSPRGRSSLSTRPPNRSAEDHQPWSRHQHQSSNPGMSPPSRAPSVQFRDTDTEAPDASQSRPQSRPASQHGDDDDQGPKGKQSLFGKLKLLASGPNFSSHSRSPSGASTDFRSAPGDIATPGSERGNSASQSHWKKKAARSMPTRRRAVASNGILVKKKDATAAEAMGGRKWLQHRPYNT